MCPRRNPNQVPRWLSRCSDWLRAAWSRGRSSSPGSVENFHFSISSRLALGALSPGVKPQGREADHSPSTNAQVNKTWIYTSTPHTPSWRSVCLVKHWDNFTFFTSWIKLRRLATEVNSFRSESSGRSGSELLKQALCNYFHFHFSSPSFVRLVNVLKHFSVF
jgi:hypothetical protein